MKRLFITALCAIGLAVQGATAQSQRSDSLFARGVELYQAGKYGEALPLFTECDSLDTALLGDCQRSGYGAMWAASCYLALGDSLKAQEWSQHGFDLPPTDRRLTADLDKKGDEWEACLQQDDQQRLKAVSQEMVAICEADPRLWSEKVFALQCLSLVCELVNDSTQALDRCNQCLDEVKRQRGEHCTLYIEELAHKGRLYAYFAYGYDPKEWGAFSAYRSLYNPDLRQAVELMQQAAQLAMEAGNAKVAAQTVKRLAELQAMWMPLVAVATLQKALRWLRPRGGMANEDYRELGRQLAWTYARFCPDELTSGIEFAMQYIDECQALATDTARLTEVERLLATMYGAAGQQEKSLELTLRAAELLKTDPGKHTDYVNTLASLPYMYQGAERLERSRQAVAELEKMELKTMDDTATYVNVWEMQARTLREMGRMEEGADAMNRAMVMLEKWLGKASVRYLSAAIEKAMMEKNLDEMGRGLNVFDTSDFNNYVTSTYQFIDDTLLVMAERGDLSRSRVGVFLNPVEFYSRVYDYYELMQTVHNNIRLNADGRHFYTSSSATSFNRVVNAQLGFDHPLHSRFYRLLALRSMGRGDAKESVKLLKEAEKLERRAYGKATPKTRATLLAAYIGSGDEKNTTKGASEAFQEVKREVVEGFGWMTSAERSAFWKVERQFFDNIPTMIGLMPGNADMAAIAYDCQLLRKGILLQSEIDLRRLILESGDEEALKDYATWQQLKAGMDEMTSNPAHYDSARYANFARLSEQLERELLERSKAFGSYTRSMNTAYADVQRALGNDEVAVEFATYFNVTNRQTNYCALVMDRAGAPRFVALPTADLLEQARQEAYTSTKMYDVVWRPLEKYIPEGARVYFAAEGLLHEVAVEYLPGTERAHFVRLSSTRQLANGDFKAGARLTDSPSGNGSPDDSRGGAVLYGGIKYTLSPSERAKASAKAGAADTFRDVPPLAQLRANRGAVQTLVGTRREVEAIGAALAQAQVPCTTLTGEDATEESVKALTGGHASLLHLATHGFYESADEAGADEDEQLSRSGLLMAGAADAISASTAVATDDGILTAREISRLDLRGLDLVVLSACETALGDVSGEGVFGLQRGFKKAGAQTLLMSLWKVDDTATQLLMTEFYRQLTAGLSRREAFLAAQRHLRQHDGGRYDRPECWAAFIMLDGI